MGALRLRPVIVVAVLIDLGKCRDPDPRRLGTPPLRSIDRQATIKALLRQKYRLCNVAEHDLSGRHGSFERNSY
jgi:hypothetical protein